MPIDEPSDLLYRLIVHELTHLFQFDIIPTVLIRRNMPLWVFEGMSDYMTGYWRPLDLMTVRDAAVADIVPQMSELQGYGGFGNAAPDLQPRPRRVRVHRVDAGARKACGSSSSRCARASSAAATTPIEEAFQIDAEEWDQQFDRYLKDRFKPFRDKERPADYGRDLAPNRAQDQLLAACSRSSRRPRAT